MSRDASPPCQSDLACVRNDGHTGNHAYPLDTTKPQPATPSDDAAPPCEHDYEPWTGVACSKCDEVIFIDPPDDPAAPLREAAQRAALSDHAPMFADGGVYRACGCAVHAALRAALATPKEPQSEAKVGRSDAAAPPCLEPCPYCEGEMCARMDGLGCTHDAAERHGYCHPSDAAAPLRNQIIVAAAGVLRNYVPDLGSSDRATVSEAIADAALATPAPKEADRE